MRRIDLLSLSLAGCIAHGLSAQQASIQATPRPVDRATIDRSLDRTADPMLAPELAMRAAGGPASAFAPHRKDVPHTTAGPLAAVLFDRPAADGPLWAMGHLWKASFDRQGCTFIPFFGSKAPTNFPLRIELASATVGGQPLDLQPGQPAQVGESVRTPRGSLTEVFDLRLRSAEQSFVFDTLPARGALHVALRLESKLACTPLADGLRFANEHGSVDYRKAIAIDAGGAQIALDIGWDGALAHLEIPAEFVARAKLPLVLDPVLNVNNGVATGGAATRTDPDVAILPDPASRTLITWRVDFSATDHDVLARIVDNFNQTPTTAVFAIDVSTLDYRVSAASSNRAAQNFMVVSEVLLGTLYYVAGRTVSPAGAVGGPFDIERQGTVGGLGNNVTPSIGTNHAAGAGYCVVFEKQFAASRDIYFKMVNTDGTLPNPNPTALDLSAQAESFPRISKYCGPTNAFPAAWMITWQTQYGLPPFDQNVMAALVSDTGVILRAPFSMANTNAEERNPAASSPADIHGNRYWMLTYDVESGVGQQRDIVCLVIDRTSPTAYGMNLGAFELGGAFRTYDQFAPHVDSDGVRFAVTYSEVNPGAHFDTRATTVQWNPPSLLFTAMDQRAGLGTSPANELLTRTCAFSSSGVRTIPRYLVVSILANTNDVAVYDYAGRGSGNPFNSRPTQCGNLPITGTGTSSPGDTLRFTISGGGLMGTMLGLPGTVSLAPVCNCTLGVVNALNLPNPLVLTIPVAPELLGVTLAVQGFGTGGTACLSQLDFSFTIDFTIL